MNPVPHTTLRHQRIAAGLVAAGLLVDLAHYPVSLVSRS